MVQVYLFHGPAILQISDETVWDFEFGSVSVFLGQKNLGIGIKIGIKSVSESYRYEIGMNSVSV